MLGKHSENEKFTIYLLVLNLEVSLKFSYKAKGLRL